MSANVCPQCGAPIESGITTCRYCGEPINNVQSQQIQAVQPSVVQQPVNPYAAPVQNQMRYNPNWPIKNKIAAGLLAIFLGGFGIHKFYLGKVGMGILYLVFCWTYIPALIGFVEGIIYLTQSDHNFCVKNKVLVEGMDNSFK
ncbi:MAG: TM2 domain-containing protein [Clostridiales bacterium]|nr:TM2 domain-containing protein [Clostridiales bacterium]